MKVFQVALYPGDGIGPEVIDQAVRVLDRVQEITGDFKLSYTRFPWGAEFYAEHGTVTPADFLDRLRPFDAIFLGALGYPQKIPDHLTLAPLVQLRQKFDQYACVRPARLLPGVKSPLANPGLIDMVVVRENSEGEYVTCGGRFKSNEPEEFAVQTSLHTRKGIERILRFGFDMARARRKHLTMITKSNALKFGMVLWDEILEELKPHFSDIEVDKLHIDAAAMDFVRRPGRFDVVVASNLFGDILTDLAGAIIGGLGLAPSANINPERTFPSMFEPVHGSAPDITGKGIANPTAAIQSAAMMLDWLGLPVAARTIQTAVETTILQGSVTPDLGGRLTTQQMADKIIENMKEEKA
jgi:tartrate dehydrogenase/decarboxylase / D-malate dehydrogenase